ncbi:MAG TPA: PH domain-containing protein [Patescibacteria group bacterium]|jgi:hypothetical protein|nr:PH domain-containing protein [Patescibacteria group bacterium]
MTPDQQQPPVDKPIAYDAEGNPLYAAPQPQTMPAATAQRSSHVMNAPDPTEGHNFDPRARVQYGNEPRVFHTSRPYEPSVNEVGPDLKARHDASTEAYPDLNLSEGEYVIMSVKRHPIGLWGPLAATISAIVLLLVAWISYPSIAQVDQQTGEIPAIGPVSVILFSLIILIGIFGYITTWVYMRNTFYLTNESVIQEIQHGIFSKHEQTVSLGSIEDASYRQFGIWQSMFNYGTIRLSTEGEETTYRFQYVANPKKQIATLNNAIEAFKNGRPVWTNHEDDA